MHSRTHHQQRLSHQHDGQSTDRIRSMHDIFSDPFRCAILYYLQERGNPADVEELSERVLDWCPDEEELPPNRARRRAWLFNEHIVRMDDFGVVSYDPREDSIRLAEDVSVTLPDLWKGSDFN